MARCPFSLSHHSPSEWAPPPVPPRLIVTAGMPLAKGMLALVWRFDTQTQAITTLAPALEGSEDLASTRNGLLLMSNSDRIYCCKPGARGRWQLVTMKGAALPLKKASRLATNPANDRLAVVVSE